MSDCNSEGDPAAPHTPEPSLVDVARTAFDGAIKVAEASLALLFAELQLAKRSATTIIWLAFALIFLGATAWLSFAGAIAVGVYQLSGNLFLGIATVAAINIAGVLWTIAGMRRCWRDLTFPHTRALISSGSVTVPQLQEKP